eukprot:gene10037-7012_t
MYASLFLHKLEPKVYLVSFYFVFAYLSFSYTIVGPPLSLDPIWHRVIQDRTRDNTQLPYISIFILLDSKATIICTIRALIVSPCPRHRQGISYIDPKTLPTSLGIAGQDQRAALHPVSSPSPCFSASCSPYAGQQRGGDETLPPPPSPSETGSATRPPSTTPPASQPSTLDELLQAFPEPVSFPVLRPLSRDAAAIESGDAETCRRAPGGPAWRLKMWERQQDTSTPLSAFPEEASTATALVEGKGAVAAAPAPAPASSPYEAVEALWRPAQPVTASAPAVVRPTHQGAAAGPHPGPPPPPACLFPAMPFTMESNAPAPSTSAPERPLTRSAPAAPPPADATPVASASTSSSADAAQVFASCSEHSAERPAAPSWEVRKVRHLTNLFGCIRYIQHVRRLQNQQAALLRELQPMIRETCPTCSGGPEAAPTASAYQEAAAQRDSGKTTTTARGSASWSPLTRSSPSISPSMRPSSDTAQQLAALHLEARVRYSELERGLRSSSSGSPGRTRPSASLPPPPAGFLEVLQAALESGRQSRERSSCSRSRSAAGRDTAMEAPLDPRPAETQLLRTSSSRSPSPTAPGVGHRSAPGDEAPPLSEPWRPLSAESSTPEERHVVELRRQLFLCMQRQAQLLPALCAASDPSQEIVPQYPYEPVTRRLGRQRSTTPSTKPHASSCVFFNEAVASTQEAQELLSALAGWVTAVHGTASSSGAGTTGRTQDGDSGGTSPSAISSATPSPSPFRAAHAKGIGAAPVRPSQPMPPSLSPLSRDSASQPFSCPASPVTKAEAHAVALHAGGGGAASWSPASRRSSDRSAFQLLETIFISPMSAVKGVAQEGAGTAGHASAPVDPSAAQRVLFCTAEEEEEEPEVTGTSGGGTMMERQEALRGPPQRARHPEGAGAAHPSAVEEAVHRDTHPLLPAPTVLPTHASTPHPVLSASRLEQQHPYLNAAVTVAATAPSPWERRLEQYVEALRRVVDSEVEQLVAMPLPAQPGLEMTAGRGAEQQGEHAVEVGAEKTRAERGVRLPSRSPPLHPSSASPPEAAAFCRSDAALDMDETADTASVHQPNPHEERCHSTASRSAAQHPPHSTQEAAALVVADPPSDAAPASAAAPPAPVQPELIADIVQAVLHEVLRRQRKGRGRRHRTSHHRQSLRSANRPQHEAAAASQQQETQRNTNKSRRLKRRISSSSTSTSAVSSMRRVALAAAPRRCGLLRRSPCGPQATEEDDIRVENSVEFNDSHTPRGSHASASSASASSTSPRPLHAAHATRAISRHAGPPKEADTRDSGAALPPPGAFREVWRRLTQKWHPRAPSERAMNTSVSLLTQDRSDTVSGSTENEDPYFSLRGPYGTPAADHGTSRSAQRRRGKGARGPAERFIDSPFACLAPGAGHAPSLLPAFSITAQGRRCTRQTEAVRGRAEAGYTPGRAAALRAQLWRRLEETSALLPQFRTPSQSRAREEERDGGLGGPRRMSRAAAAELAPSPLDTVLGAARELLAKSRAELSRVRQEDEESEAAASPRPTAATRRRSRQPAPSSQHAGHPFGEEAALPSSQQQQSGVAEGLIRERTPLLETLGAVSPCGAHSQSDLHTSYRRQPSPSTDLSDSRRTPQQHRAEDSGGAAEGLYSPQEPSSGGHTASMWRPPPEGAQGVALWAEPVQPPPPPVASASVRAALPDLRHPPAPPASFFQPRPTADAATSPIAVRELRAAAAAAAAVGASTPSPSPVRGSDDNNAYLWSRQPLPPPPHNTASQVMSRSPFPTYSVATTATTRPGAATAAAGSGSQRATGSGSRPSTASYLPTPTRDNLAQTQTPSAPATATRRGPSASQPNTNGLGYAGYRSSSRSVSANRPLNMSPKYPTSIHAGSSARNSMERDYHRPLSPHRRDALLQGLDKELLQLGHTRDELMAKHALLYEKRLQLAQKMREKYAITASNSNAMGARRPTAAETERLARVARTSQAALEHVESRLELVEASMRKVSKQRDLLLESAA